MAVYAVKNRGKCGFELLEDRSAPEPARADQAALRAT
jgi:hypothetical protein